MTTKNKQSDKKRSEGRAEQKRISVEDYNQQCSNIIEKNKKNPEWFPDTLLELLEFAGKCTIIEIEDKKEDKTKEEEKEDIDLKPITKDELDIINNEYARGYNDALEMATRKLKKITNISQKNKGRKRGQKKK